MTYDKRDLNLNITCTTKHGPKLYFGLEDVIDAEDLLVMARKDDKNPYTLPKSIAYPHFNEELNIDGKTYGGLIRFYGHSSDFQFQNKKYNLVRKFLLFLEDGIEGKSHLYVAFFEIDKKKINKLLKLDHLMDYAEDKKKFLSLLMQSSRLREELTMDNNKGFLRDDMSCMNKYSGSKKFN